jgi:DNA-binding transcriptional LysR family regulator
MDQLKAIECFLAVAQTGSFSKAADRLHKPVSSVSRQVSALEESLKAQLLVRSTRKLRLTEVGKLYLKSCESVTTKLAQAREQIVSYQSEPNGVLSISAMPSFGELVLTPLIEEFQQIYPKIIIDADFSDEVRDPMVNEIDISFRGGAQPDQRLIAKKVMDNHFHLCAAPSYLETFGTPKTIADLASHKAIYYRGPKGKIPWWVEHEGGHQQCLMDAVIITNGGSLLFNSVLKGKGLCLLPMWSIKNHLAQGKLTLIEMDNPPQVIFDNTMGIYLLYQQSRYQMPKVRCAIDFFSERLVNP